MQIAEAFVPFPPTLCWLLSRTAKERIPIFTTLA